MNLNQHPLIQAYIEHNAFGRFVHMNFAIQDAGKVTYWMEITADLLATPKAAHGGVIASLLDATLGVAALSAVCERGQVVSTIELTSRFHAPAFLGDKLTSTGQLISKGNRILVAEGKIFNQDNELIATGTGTFNAYPKEKAGF